MTKPLALGTRVILFGPGIEPEPARIVQVFADRCPECGLHAYIASSEGCGCYFRVCASVIRLPN